MEPALAHADQLRALGALLDGSHLIHPDRLPDVVGAAAREIGWEVTLFLADDGDYTLRPLLSPGSPDEPTLDVEGTTAGRCFRHVAPEWRPSPSPHLWVPLLDGVERLGVMRIRMPAAAGPPEPGTLEFIRWFAHLSAHLVASKSAYADVFHLVRRREPRSVASELIWSLLPPLAVACHGLVIAGTLEPSHSVAGDVFDYAIDRDVAHVVIADATGHDLSSSIIGALVLAAYRTGRRTHAGLHEIVRQIDSTLLRHGEHTFATGVFGQLDLTSGVYRYINAGHPSPLLLRRGRVVRALDGGRRTLLGLPSETNAGDGVAEEQLEPGDWIVHYTDGVTEARDAARQFFGVERLVDVVERCASDGQPAPETLRRVTHRVLEHQHGVLQDDATLVIVQWATGSEHQLRST